MSAIPWMPFYVSDYLSDTGHLSTIQHGAYLLLIFHYWQNDGLPEADDAKARIARVTMSEWKKMRSIIAALFDPEWHHKRIDKELAVARDHISKRTAAGKAGASARYGNRSATAEANAKQTNAPLPTPVQTPEEQEPKESVVRGSQANAPPKRAKARSQIPEDCPSSADQELARQSWGTKARFDLTTPEALSDQIAKFRAHHQKLGSTMADWSAAWRTWYLQAPERTKANGHGHQRESSHQQLARVSAEMLAASDRETDADAPQRAEPSVPAAGDERRAIPRLGEAVPRRPEGLQ